MLRLGLVEKIHEQFPEEKIRYHCWVKKINERKTVQDRLLVVGDVHIFTLKASLLGTGSIARVGHLFDIEALESQQQNEVKINFRVEDTSNNNLLVVVHQVPHIPHSGDRTEHQEAHPRDSRCTR